MTILSKDLAKKVICKKLIIYKKSTKLYEIVLTRNNLPEDITGWTIYLTVKNKKSDSDANAVITKKVTTHSDPVGGISDIQLTTEDTDRIGNYYYSIDYKDDSTPANEDVLFYGKINFKKVVLQSRT